MNAVEMHHSFLKKSETFTAKPMDTYRIQGYLNEAQDIFIEDWYKVFETSERAKKTLSPLIKNYSEIPDANGVNNISSNAQFVDMPTDVRYALQERCLTSSSTINVKPIKYDEFNIDVDNPFEQPYSKLIWRLDYGDSAIKHELVHDGSTTITSYKLRYIKIPTAIDIFDNTSSELRSIDHETIVNIAINLAYGNNKNE